MKGWTAFLYPQQVKHISIFITRWKIQHVKIFALKMFLTSEMQMLEQTASIRDPAPSNQGVQCPAFRGIFHIEYEKPRLSHILFHLLENLRAASPDNLVSPQFASPNLGTLKRKKFFWSFVLLGSHPRHMKVPRLGV